MTHTELDAAFYPNAIAVVGATDNPASLVYLFTRCLLDFGYSGKIYPVNPKMKKIFGMRAYPSLDSIEGPVDYVICAIGAPGIPALLDECQSRDVKVVHVFSGRLSETGHQGAKDLEAEILSKAKQLKIRLIGPNCMGIYHPEQGISFNDDVPEEPGEIGVICQSGGLATLLVRYGGLRGLRFSKVVSYGNALDLNECDYLEYFARDDKTRIIVCYIEGVRDGRRFLEVLGNTAGIKPVIILKGGRSQVGIKTATSHTSMMTGSDAIWQAVFRQTGVIQVRDLNELTGVLLPFSFFPPIKGGNVGILGAGGGQSVLTADICEARGLSIPPLPPEIKNLLKSKIADISEWIGNPIDVSAVAAFIKPEMLLEMLARSSRFDLVFVNIDEGSCFAKDAWSAIIENVIEKAITLSQKRLKPIVVTLTGGEIHFDQFSEWRWKFLARLKTRLVAAHIPTYSTITEAATAMSRYLDYYQER